MGEFGWPSGIMGIRFSLGTVSQAHGLVSEALAEPVAQLHAELQHAPVCHADETRHQSHNQQLWMWALASDWGVRFRIDVSRGQMAARLLLGDQPSFITVSDRYAGYNHLPLEQRQVCWAHLLRDFERIAGRTALAGLIGRRLLGYGYLLFRWRDQGKDVRHYDWLQKRIRAQLDVGRQQKVCSRTANTCTNLLKIWPALCLREQPAGAADEQCRRAGAARLCDQAQAVVLHPVGPGPAVHGTDLLGGADLQDAGARGVRLHRQRRAELAGRHTGAQPGARAHPSATRLRVSHTNLQAAAATFCSSRGGVNTYP